MDRKCGDVNYDDVNMDMSDSDDSDNEMFANKKEYESYKQHFNNVKPSKVASAPSGEYGGEVEEESEYGGGSDKLSVVGSKLGQNDQQASGGPTFVKDHSRSVMTTNDKKVERKPMMYGDKNKRSPERRSKSRERRDRRRSGSREDRRRRSRSRDRDRRRSRSRSPNRDRGGHHRGGWGRDRDRHHDRRRGREEAARNHEEQVQKAREMGVEVPKYLKPGAVNPLSYAEQMQKRKALWAKPASSSSSNPTPSQEEAKPEVEVKAQAPSMKPVGGSYNNWESTNFGNDKVNEKFRRLMGIKSGGGSEAGDSGREKTGQAYAPNHDKIMNDLDRNYEAARQQTHRNRGIGLGFSDGGLGVPHQMPHQEPAPPLPAAPAPHNMFKNSGWQNRPTGGINFVKKH